MKEEDLKRCSKCKKVSSKLNFSKNGLGTNGLRSQCIIGTKHYHSDNKEQRNLRERKRRHRDIYFKLLCNIRNRTCRQAFKTQNVKKLGKTFNLLGRSNSFLQRWIIYQLHGNKNIESFGSVCQIDNCYPLSKAIVSNKTDMFKSTFWTNLRPMYFREKISKGSEIDHHLYLLQEIKASFFWI